MVTVSFENEPRHERRQDPAECAKALVDAGADIVGINCLRSPEHTLPLMEEMRKAVTPLACQPVGYRTPARQPDFTSLPQFPHELDRCSSVAGRWPTTPGAPGTSGSNYIGSCCGAVASHVAGDGAGARQAQREEPALAGATTGSRCRPTSTTSTKARSSTARGDPGTLGVADEERVHRGPGARR